MQTLNSITDQFSGSNSAQSHYIASIPAQTPRPATPENTRLSGQEVAVTSVGLLLLFSYWYFARQDFRRRKASSNELQTTAGSSSKAETLAHCLPCTQCHYFKANMYLSCAVNPTVVLKPEAKDCQEFIAREEHRTQPPSRPWQQW